MAISLPCPVCNATLKAPDAAAGRTLQCPGCLTPVLIPGRLPPPNKPAQKEEILDAVAVAEDELDVLEEVDDGGELEEVVPVTAGDLLGDSRLLRQREITIRARKYDIGAKYIDQDLRDYDLCLPEGGKRLGRAREVRDAGTQAARLLGFGQFASKYLEICEGPDAELLATIRRAPMPMGLKQALEICDADDRALGLFERSTWGALLQESVWITSPSGRKKILQMKPQLSRGRCLFLTPGGRPAAELVLAEQGIRVHWVKRDASSYHLRFRPALDDRPRDKLLCLAVALGLEA
jgi:hypothetical protein